ncbi:MAG: hypothetical protein ACKOQS_00245, partial [Dolichospermum sp.]
QKYLDREISQIIRFFLTQNQSALILKFGCHTAQMMEKPSLPYHQGFLLLENSEKDICWEVRI